MAATALDLGVGLGLALALASTLGLYFARRAVVMLHIGEPDSIWQGPVPLMLGVVGEVVYLLPCVLWLVWLIDPITGATIGKRILGLRVCDRSGATASWFQRWSRHLLHTVSLWGTTLGLVTGQWQVAVLALAVGGVTAAPTLVDRLTGTAVVRTVVSN